MLVIKRKKPVVIVSLSLTAKRTRLTAPITQSFVIEVAVVELFKALSEEV